MTRIEASNTEPVIRAEIKKNCCTKAMYNFMHFIQTIFTAISERNSSTPPFIREGRKELGTDTEDGYSSDDEEENTRKATPPHLARQYFISDKVVAPDTVAASIFLVAAAETRDEIAGDSDSSNSSGSTSPRTKAFNKLLARVASTDNIPTEVRHDAKRGSVAGEAPSKVQPRRQRSRSQQDHLQALMATLKARNEKKTN